MRAEQISRLTENKAFDISRAEVDLDFRPRSFSEGIDAEARRSSCVTTLVAASSRAVCENRRAPPPGASVAPSSASDAARCSPSLAEAIRATVAAIV